MPSNLVKSKADEELWSEAKSRAKDQGHSDNYAYITSIYMNMKKHKKTAYEVIRSIVAKVLSKEERGSLIETLSDQEHQQWWQFAKSKIDQVLPETAERWKKLFVPYDELPEEEKAKDRPFALKTLKVLEDYDLI